MRPYKHNFRNIADILTLAVLEAMSFELFAAAYHSPTVQTAPYQAIVPVLVLGVPHMILLVYMPYLSAKKVGIMHSMSKNKVQTSERKCAEYQRHTSV